MAKTFITAVMAPDDDHKLGGQAKVIMDTLIGKVGLNQELDREDLIAEIDAQHPEFSAKQSTARVVGYYCSTPRLVEKGFITLRTEKAEPKPKKQAASDGPTKAEASGDAAEPAEAAG